MIAFWEGFEKRASQVEKPGLLEATEIGGLGTLAANEVAGHMAHGGSRMRLAAELGGLGVLAVPSVYKTGKYLYNKFTHPNKVA
jgi:hypothetical protein